MRRQQFDMVVVGGGLAGLTSAIVAARSGMRVAVLERGEATGGRARTTSVNGYRLNLGPRALYEPAARILDELGIEYTGGRPSLGGYAVFEGRLHDMPGGPEALLAGGLFSSAEASAAMEALTGLLSSPSPSLAYTSLKDWADSRRLDGKPRHFLETLVRLAGYIHAPDLLPAVAAKTQLLVGSSGLVYVDGGWTSLIDSMTRTALGLGVQIRNRWRVTGIEQDGGGVRGVDTAEGESVGTDNVVLAVQPDEAEAILGRGAVVQPETRPVRAAVMDVALTKLPNPRGGFVLALDRPLYLSVHSLAARLAPEGGAVVHVARYLHPLERPSSTEVRRELEGLMDMVQPGWRAATVFERFLPGMIVTHGLPMAANGGVRPNVAVPGLSGAYLAGDWVGDEHQLAAAALASGKRAAELALRIQDSRAAAVEV